MDTDTGDTATPLYRHRFVAAGYDALNALLWLPTGSRRLRAGFVASLGLGPGDRVLELGCGTGLVTRHLCATGAQVVALDRSPLMLATARRRAPSATFAVADVTGNSVDGSFDHVVLAFVLHELSPSERIEVLRWSIERLRPSGRIGILDWAQPPTRRGRAWASVVRMIEPPVAHDVLHGAIEAAVTTAGWSIAHHATAAAGRARVLHVQRAG